MEAVDTSNEPKGSISDRDVVFECPSCTKSLAIDRRGAGLTIACPQCNEPVRVPMPPDEFVQHPETDHTEEFADATELLAGLSDSQVKVQELTDNLNALRKQHQDMETQQNVSKKTIAKLRQEFSSIQSALDNIYEHLGNAD